MSIAASASVCSNRRSEIPMDDDRPILIAGRTGQVARALLDLAVEYNVPLVAVGRPQLDLADPASIERVATSIAPRAIVNAAAYTAVDRAEAEPALAFAVNRDGAAQLAAAAARLRIPFVHMSTDYVFDGHKVSPYLEDDPLAPLSVYGQSKLAGEQAVREIYPGSLVLRTSWVYSSSRPQLCAHHAAPRRNPRCRAGNR